MIDLSFSITGAEARENAAAPTLCFRLRIHAAGEKPMHAILLRCQVQIEPRRRRHADEEQARLQDVFGTPERWSRTLRPLPWIQTTINVPAFEREIEVDVPVTCTYDFEVIAAKYLQALDGGELPLLFLFSGTVFAKSEYGFHVEQVPWSKEASYRMPVQVWRDVMDSYFPGCAWIRVSRESRDALHRFRSQKGLASWDEVIDALLGVEAVK